ncbi:MAG: heparan-alpha-glucosaminide N-acetyltransferase [Sulfuricellaceae bacterium]|nr:heparan-alpha-glucosaminide N-acetyltransferase [Sulfuricellaceae bacterium]
MKKSGNKKNQKAGSPPAPGRVQLFDLMRGFAIALMVGYHFCFDLKHFGLTQFDFKHDLFWLAARSLILSLFLGLVGISLVLATAGGFNLRRYFTRLGWLAAAALLTSISSRMIFPESWIFFGVLHLILFASIVGLAFVRLYWLNLGLGILIILAGLTFQHPVFDHPWLQWMGLVTHKPITEDYVPLMPWLGIVLIGSFLGKFFLRSSWKPVLAAWRSNHSIARMLALAGRHSLLIYMLHQPVLMGLLWVGLRALNMG